jgi:hypothetical protein
MAPLPPSRPSRHSWIVLCSLLLAFVVWFVLTGNDNKTEEQRARVLSEQASPKVIEVVETTGAQTPPSVPLNVAVADPPASQDKAAEGTVRVLEVVSDRGFFATANGQQLFLFFSHLVIDRPQLKVGDELWMRGLVKHPSSLHPSEDEDVTPEEAKRATDADRAAAAQQGGYVLVTELARDHAVNVHKSQTAVGPPPASPLVNVKLEEQLSEPPALIDPKTRPVTTY